MPIITIRNFHCVPSSIDDTGAVKLYPREEKWNHPHKSDLTFDTAHLRLEMLRNGSIMGNVDRVLSRHTPGRIYLNAADLRTIKNHLPSELIEETRPTTRHGEWGRIIAPLTGLVFRVYNLHHPCLVFVQHRKGRMIESLVRGQVQPRPSDRFIYVDLNPYTRAIIDI